MRTTSVVVALALAAVAFVAAACSDEEQDQTVVESNLPGCGALARRDDEWNCAIVFPGGGTCGRGLDASQRLR